MANNYVWGDRSLGYLDDPRMHPMVKEFMNDVLKESKYDLSVIDGARVQDDQMNLFLAKLTELDGLNDLSDHQVEKYEDMKARALDFIPFVPKLKIDIWDITNPTTCMVWAECHRAFLRVDRLWKKKGIDVGLELGWTYNIAGGRDYPHVGFTKI